MIRDRNRAKLLKLLFALLFALFAASCSQVLSPASRPDSSAPSGVFVPQGYGAVDVRMGQTVCFARTILPQAPLIAEFQAFTFVFTGVAGTADRTFHWYQGDSPRWYYYRSINGTPQRGAQQTGQLILPSGTYQLLVNAYRDAGRTRLAAQGRVGTPPPYLSIVEGSGNPLLTIQLAVMADGEGTFSWDIALPTGLTSATMEITYGPTAVPNPVDLVAESSGSRILGSGMYRVLFTMRRLAGDLLYEAGWSELLYIYPELYSDFTRTITAANFRRV